LACFVFVCFLVSKGELDVRRNEINATAQRTTNNSQSERNAPRVVRNVGGSKIVREKKGGLFGLPRHGRGKTPKPFAFPSGFLPKPTTVPLEFTKIR
jgi:hypothetical protein